MGRKAYGENKSKYWLAGFIVCLIFTIGFSATTATPYITPRANDDNTTEYSATVYSVSHEIEGEDNYYIVVINEYNKLRLRVNTNSIINRGAIDSLTENTTIYFRLWEPTLEDFLNSLEKYPMLENQIAIYALRTKTEEIMTIESGNEAQNEERRNDWIIPACVAAVFLIVACICLYKYIKKVKQEKRLKMYRGENNLQ